MRRRTHVTIHRASKSDEYRRRRKKKRLKLCVRATSLECLWPDEFQMPFVSNAFWPKWGERKKQVEEKIIAFFFGCSSFFFAASYFGVGRVRENPCVPIIIADIFSARTKIVFTRFGRLAEKSAYCRRRHRRCLACFWYATMFLLLGYYFFFF